MDLYLILHYYSCTAIALYCHFRNIEVESNDGSHLESLDALGPGRRIFKQEVSLKNIEGYRDVGSLNDSFQSSNFFIGTLCCCCSLLISVNGKTY